MYTHSDIVPNTTLKSQDINSNFRNIYNDIRDLYARTRQIKADQLVLSAVAENASSVIAAKIAELQITASLLETDIVIKTLYSSSGVIYPTDPTAVLALHEPDYGRAILNVTTSKRYFMTVDAETGDLIPIPEIYNYLDWYSSSNRIDNNMDEIVETDIKDAFYADPRKLYMRKFTTSLDDVTEVDLMLVATMPDPESIVNSIKISPFPEGMTDITSLTYESSGTSGLKFQRPSGTYYETSFENSRKLAFSTIPTSIDGLKVLLTQQNRKYDGPYSFFLGLHSLVIENCLYENTSYIGFELTREDGNISSVEQVLTNFDDDSYEHPVSFRIYTTREDFDEMNSNYIYDSSNSSPITPSNPLGTDGSYDTIYILYKLQKYNVEATPELKYLVVKWR